MNTKTTVITTSAIIFIVSAIFVSAPSWRDIATKLGGVETLNDESGKPCYWFEKDQQLICYREVKTWFGQQDAAPAYVIDHGKYIPLF